MIKKERWLILLMIGNKINNVWNDLWNNYWINDVLTSQPTRNRNVDNNMWGIGFGNEVLQ